MSCKYSNYWCLNIKMMVHQTLLHMQKPVFYIYIMQNFRKDQNADI